MRVRSTEKYDGAARGEGRGDVHARSDGLEEGDRRGRDRHRRDARRPYCPGDLTHAKREKKCVSVQEHVWGTDGLAKLEAIKAKLDPQGLFQCPKCVGFKGPVRDQ